ncbi:DgyrCDS5118 [Dimorphilus gyrociliatus]|uniref:DgyrCDS5118 n=1 Tax=Dimorphilus gyrociliatus TaxID=2664684 RepID=A0A7I8VIT7_9ANNE|nr:DgyrCDS5118 [Dimorphilus gyrociliatus]
MYRKEKPINFQGSASAINNNLSIGIQSDKDRLHYAIVHKSVVNVITASLDGKSVSTRQVACKEQASVASCVVIQAKIVKVAERLILVVTSQKGIHIYEVEGLLLLYAFSLPQPESTHTCTLARGIAVLLDNVVCIGTYEGHVLILSVPSKGNNIELVETLRFHTYPIAALDGVGECLVVADEKGELSVWSAGQPFTRTNRGVAGTSSDCVTSLALCANNLIACSTSSGAIRLLCVETCNVLAQIDGHARCITSLSSAPKSGLILSTSEDCMVRVWRVMRNKTDIEVELVFSEHVADTMLQGSSFLSPNGKAFALTAYDSSKLLFYFSQ